MGVDELGRMGADAAMTARPTANLDRISYNHFREIGDVQKTEAFTQEHVNVATDMFVAAHHFARSHHKSMEDAGFVPMVNEMAKVLAAAQAAAPKHRSVTAAYRPPGAAPFIVRSTKNYMGTRPGRTHNQADLDAMIADGIEVVVR